MSRAGLARADRLPEILRRVGARPVDIDHAAVLDGAEADDRVFRACQPDVYNQPVAQLQRSINQRRPDYAAPAGPRPKAPRAGHRIRENAVD